MSRAYRFLAYRLNVVERTLFSDLYDRTITNDGDIVDLLMECANPSQDQIIEAKKNVYKWAVRGVQEFASDGHGRVVTFKIVRSVVREESDVLTDEDVSSKYVDHDPPIATTSTCVLFLERHAVCIESNAKLMQSDKWISYFHEIVHGAAESLSIGSHILLEAMPSDREILEAFETFDKLTRLRVTLRRPNPELSRQAKALYGQMTEARLQEWLHDMKSPSGISREDESVPKATVDIAQRGYKKGTVTMEGMREGSHQRVVTGGKAARGSVGDLRDFVRGLSANTKTKEGERIIRAVKEELDRIAPPPDDEE